MIVGDWKLHIGRLPVAGIVAAVLLSTIGAGSAYGIEAKSKADDSKAKSEQAEKAPDKDAPKAAAEDRRSDRQEKAVLLKKLQTDVDRSRREQPNDKYDVPKPKKTPKATLKPADVAEGKGVRRAVPEPDKAAKSPEKTRAVKRGDAPKKKQSTEVKTEPKTKKKKKE